MGGDGAREGRARIVVQVRLTREERSRLAENARRAGLTVSGYVRARAVYVGCDEPRADAKLMRALLSELGRIGNNVNQLARIAHARGPAAGDAERIASALSDLSSCAARLRRMIADTELPGRRNR